MNELTTDFQSLPQEYQHIIKLAQDTYEITVSPLQLLVGGWSGAVVYLVSVSSNETQRVEHCILKLDRKGKSAKSDEVTRHNAVVSKSTPEFARDHIAELVFDRVEQEGAIAIFYRIAGQSLLKYRPLSSYGRQSQLKTIFTQTNTILLSEWNRNATFAEASHPQKVLEKWLGFRLDAGGHIEHFLQETCRVNPEVPGLLISGRVFPNPLLYARKPEPWGKARSIDIAIGFIHGDLNTNNILVMFSKNNEKLQGYYLIDFALFKDQMPLLYDQRYLEMSYLIQAISQISFAKCVDFLTLLAVADAPDPHKGPIETSGIGVVVASARSAFAAWVQEKHPSLHDDLWGQYWLAGVAAGLAYCHKAGQPNEQRLAGLIYASANLKRYATIFNLSRPTDVELLYEENQFGSNKPVSVSKREEHKPVLPSGTVTFLFTDIEGSTKLSQQYPEAMPALLARHHEILNQAITAHNGFAFEIVGDSFYVAFHNASDALEAALDIQRALHQEAWSPMPIKVRIGLHTGTAQLQDASQSLHYKGYTSLALSQRIMSAGHGGQILLSQITVDLIGDKLPDGARLTDMRERHLKDVAQPVHIYQLTVPDLPPAFPPLKAEQAVNHNLPVQLTAFIGRSPQIVAIKELLQREDVHLVTLLGPGGTGKTRLSLQVAQEMLDQFHHGVFFVPLADDTNANQLISRVAQQLAVREGGRPLLENVKDFLRDKNILLVLDNFEQLISAAPIVADLLANASQLKILVSSRIALNLYGEREFPVPPLELPQTENELSLENLIGNESVTLFVERVQAVQPGFALTQDNASAVAEICRRLDGLPLALELAAARVKLLPPQAILARLDDRLKLLTGGARDLPARHQTLRNTLEWSYSLLNEDEKTLYARLSVFVGGFTLEAAEAVCKAEGRLDIPEGLTSLVNNSLLRQEDTLDGEPRFGMLESIRAYALERLAESGEMEILSAGHAQYYGGIILNQAGYGLSSPNALHWLNWLERELDNIRATLSWCVASPQGIELGAGLFTVLGWFWYRRGYVTEGRLWAQRVLISPVLQENSMAQAITLAISGMMATWQGEQETGLTHMQSSLAIVQRLEDEQVMPQLLMGTAIAFINRGQDRAAQPLLKEALPLFEQQNLPFFHTITMVHLGNVELGLGNPEQARLWHEKAQTEALALGENWILSFALNNLGEVARTQGQYELARKYYEECEALLGDTGDTGDLARFIHNLGYVAQHEGDFTRAESQFRKSLTMFRRFGNRRGIAECLAGLAGLKARQGDIEWGAIMLSAAESTLKATGGAWWPADRVEVEANQEFIRSALSESELTAAQKKGRAMTLEQALAFASEGQTLS